MYGKAFGKLGGPRCHTIQSGECELFQSRVVAFALVFFRSGFDRHRLFVFLVLSLRACVNRGPSQSYYTKSISSLSSLYFPLVSLVGDDGLDMDLGT